MKSALSANDSDQVLQPTAFSGEDAPAERREPVISPSDIIQFGGGTVTRLFDEICVYEPLECPIQRRWPQPDFAIRPVQDLLHDRVAVLVLVRKREKHVEPVRFEREKGFS